MLKSRRLTSYVVISLLLHASFSAVTFLLQSTPNFPNDSISIEILNPTSAQVAPPPQEVAKTRQKTEKREKQIVEQEEVSRNEETPDDTRFLSAKNQKVEKQTVSKNRGEFKNLKKEALERRIAPQEGKKVSLAEMTPKLGKFRAYDPSAEKLDSETGSQSNEKSGSEQASATSDYIKDVDQGLETLLNAREFKYYTYYNRIRRQLSQHWEPKVRGKLSRMFKQGRHLASDVDRITKLIVVLDRQGNLVKVQMIKDSGVSDLDDAAVEAFQSAAPFPNPPQGIVEADGTVKIRWDFVLET